MVTTTTTTMMMMMMMATSTLITLHWFAIRSLPTWNMPTSQNSPTLSILYLWHAALARTSKSFVRSLSNLLLNELLLSPRVMAFLKRTSIWCEPSFLRWLSITPFLPSSLGSTIYLSFPLSLVFASCWSSCVFRRICLFYREFSELGKYCGFFDNEPKLVRAATFLHNLGSLIYFNDPDVCTIRYSLSLACVCVCVCVFVV